VSEHHPYLSCGWQKALAARGKVFADPYGAEAGREFCPHHPRECRFPGREDCPRVHLVPGIEQAGP